MRLSAVALKFGCGFERRRSVQIKVGYILIKVDGDSTLKVNGKASALKFEKDSDSLELTIFARTADAPPGDDAISAALSALEQEDAARIKQRADAMRGRKAVDEQAAFIGRRWRDSDEDSESASVLRVADVYFCLEYPRLGHGSVLRLWRTWLEPPRSAQQFQTQVLGLDRIR